MISPETLNAYLELWAKAKLSEGGAYRALWYPSATAEERYLRRGGIGSSSQGPTSVSGADVFERVDAAIAKLRQSRNPFWYSALHQRYLEIGPDETRAARLRITPEKFKSALGSARRFLRQELDA